MTRPTSPNHKFEVYKTLFHNPDDKFQTDKFFYHLALSQEHQPSNNEPQEKITLGPEVLIFLGIVIGMMTLVVVFQKIASWFKDL